MYGSRQMFFGTLFLTAETAGPAAPSGAFEMDRPTIIAEIKRIALGSGGRGRGEKLSNTPPE
jgi:hypothetical protein